MGGGHVQQGRTRTAPAQTGMMIGEIDIKAQGAILPGTQEHKLWSEVAWIQLLVLQPCSYAGSLLNLTKLQYLISEKGRAIGFIG